MAEKLPVAILGSGNIGTDLLFKIERSNQLRLRLMSGIKPDSEGLAMARERGYETSLGGVEAVCEDPEVQLVFDATSARAHLDSAPALAQAGKIAVDLTPAAIGPYVVPYVNLDQHLGERNVNLVTCGGQATVPIVAAIGRAAGVSYAEIISTISSRSAGPGTRQNIDEFTHTTAKSLETVGGAGRGKAIIILNPAEPPILMRNTVYTVVEDPDQEKIGRAVEEAVCSIQRYVPGYVFRLRPTFDDDRVTTMIEVRGAGDFLPPYAGNLDIMTAAAVRVGERFAEALAGGAGPTWG